MDKTAYQEVLEDAIALLRAAGRERRGRVRLSPEVARALDDLTPPEIAEAFGVDEKFAEALDDLAPPGSLQSLAAEVSQCRRCGLCETRTQTVFGTGNPNASLVFVGEAPGEDEDRAGEPFVGRAGQLLTKIIESGMRVPRESVYICNVLKCRPPGNRNPAPEEVAKCEPYLIEQLARIRPKVICALGKFAAQTLLKTDDSVGRMRGKWHEYQGIPLRVTYHPAYLLRTPAHKGRCWEDIQEVMKRLAEETGPGG